MQPFCLAFEPDLRTENSPARLNLLFLGDTNRVVAETPMNDVSTRCSEPNICCSVDADLKGPLPKKKTCYI